MRILASLKPVVSIAQCILVDLGSTFTKVALIDLRASEVVGWAATPSTVGTNVRIGLRHALEALPTVFRGIQDYEVRLASSSAAGGLRMVAIGLVPELTSEAAKQAALGAGARVLKVFSHALSRSEVAEIVDLKPDMLLLSGGTDGGDRRVVLQNAKTIAKLSLSIPIVVACNKEASEQVAEILVKSGMNVVVTENVMPELGKLNVEPARGQIRELFIRHIIGAKGLNAVREEVEVVMPTPSATLAAAQLLADGHGGEDGLGDLMVVEVGGATTNVHSIAETSTNSRVIRKGIEEPRAKRTVEGDLGVRVSAESLLQTVGERQIRSLVGEHGAGIDIAACMRRFADDTAVLAEDEATRSLDEALARLCVRIATERHVGRFERLQTPQGIFTLQYGKDLTELKTLIGTGGPIVRASHPARIVGEALHSDSKPHLLKPKNPRIFIDRNYIMWAAGLLSQRFPAEALRLLKESLLQLKGAS